MLRHSSLSSVAVLVAMACLPVQALQRAVISSVGSDANAASGCILSAPCRTLQVAHDVVDVGGEIVALDTAGYAPVIITKSVSILGNPGATASISVASGYGVTIATAGVNVILRNLNVNGTGGIGGVNMTAGNALTIEHCAFSNFSANGVSVLTAADVRIVNSVMRGNMRGAHIAGNASADIVSSQFMGNAFIGLSVEASSGGTTSASVSDSVASGNDFGFFAAAVSGSARMSLIRSTAANNGTVGFYNQASAGATSVMTVGSSMASGNAVGFSTSGATFESLGNNIVRQNTVASTGTIVAVSGL